MVRLFLIIPLFSCLGDVSRFLNPLDLSGHSMATSDNEMRVNALIAPNHSQTSEYKYKSFNPESDKLLLNQGLLESKLGETILHRYQCDGRIVAKATRQWKPLQVSSSFILKIVDCMPDELSASSFIRFEVWDQGKLVSRHGEPFRLAHIVDVMVLREPLTRGQVPTGDKLTTQPVDLLRGNSDAIPANTSLEGFQMANSVSIGSPLKWSNLSKVNLVHRGDVVDVFASGGGIFITMKGVSLEDGVQGGMIKVRNITSDKEFFAKVLNKNSVKVNL